MAENAAAAAPTPAPTPAPAPAPAPANGRVASPPAPNNTSTPGNDAAEVLPGYSPPRGTSPASRDEMVDGTPPRMFSSRYYFLANAPELDPARNGRSYRLCKECRSILPTRWAYWLKKRDPETPRGFWFFVTMAWRFLLTNKCPECKSKGNGRRVSPPQGQSPVRSMRRSQEETQGLADVGRPE
ncbi:hypothetical protein BDFG_02919 [Blastomyces dermatitidis ATCC 26199]|nr:hypothetical protein BDFG_02919 [Blastomyces dermatitidis ATCC 26199]